MSRSDCPSSPRGHNGGPGKRVHNSKDVCHVGFQPRRFRTLLRPLGRRVSAGHGRSPDRRHRLRRRLGQALHRSSRLPRQRGQAARVRPRGASAPLFYVDAANAAAGRVAKPASSRLPEELPSGAGRAPCLGPVAEAALSSESRSGMVAIPDQARKARQVFRSFASLNSELRREVSDAGA